MSCPRCEPSSGARRGRWLVALVVLVAGAFWLDRSGALRASSPGQPSSAEQRPAGSRGE